ncbi:hypothetical protein [Streptomyces sp. ODS28]|uniref:hypothetical protein n=1 Tax=Streptomyces sp. ODS28 TaxID=3136688 RepID=UPI0031F078C4
MRRTAETLREQSRAMKTMAQGEGLKGNYADELKEKAGGLEKRLREVAGRYEDVAGIKGQNQGPLLGWADELEDFQREANRLWRQAHDEKKTKGEEGDKGPKSPGSGMEEDPLAKLQSRYNERAGHYAGQIDDAIGDVVKDSAWENFKDGVGAVVNNKWVKIAFEVAGIVAMVIGVVALFCTPAGWLVGLATAITFAIAAKDVLALATGHGSWYSVGLDVLAIATMGAGRAAGSALKATQASTKAAASTQSGSRAGREVLRNSRGGSKLDVLKSLQNRSDVPASVKARAADLHGKIGRRALEARARGTMNEFQRTTQATKRDALRYGGDTDFAAGVNDINRMRGAYPDSSAVQNASAPTGALQTVNTGSWAAGTSLGVVPRGLGPSDAAPNKPYSEGYVQWKSQFDEPFAVGY